MDAYSYHNEMKEGFYMVIADGSRHAVSPRCSSAEFVIVFTSEMRTSPLSELLQQKHPIEFAKGSIMSQSNTSPSLVQLLKTHQKRQTDIKRQNGQLCKEATTAAGELNDTLTTTINDRISEIFVRQKEIEQESRKLSNQTTRYAKQTKQWIQTIDNFNGALKELGDVQNWASVMESDMRAVMATLELVHHGTISGATPTSDS